MGLEQRPYIGTWRMAQTKVVAHTPDALVYINGDISVPGCYKCHSKINIQPFVTSISVDAGTDAAAGSANISLVLPTHHHESLARDGQFLFYPGLEVHVYMRGYFPVKGLYSNLTTPRGVLKTDPVTGEQTIVPVTFQYSGQQGAIAEPETDTKKLGPPEKVTGFETYKRKEPITGIVLHESVSTSVTSTEKALQSGGNGVHYIVDMDGHAYMYYDPSEYVTAHTGAGVNTNATTVGIEFVNPYKPSKTSAGQTVLETPWAAGGKYVVPPAAQLEAGYAVVYQVGAKYGVPVVFPGATGDSFQMSGSGINGSGIRSHQQIGDHADGSFPALYMAIRARGYNPAEAYAAAVEAVKQGGKSVVLPPVKGYATAPSRVILDPKVAENMVRKVIRTEAQPSPEQSVLPEETEERINPEWGPSMLDELGLTNTDMDNLLAYPYYHTFHGVVKSVAYSWSAGSHQVTLACASMLYFWSYQQMSTMTSVLGARPQNSKARMSLQGHNFTGMHPYEIIYMLHYDTAGAAGGVAWHLQQKTNQTARSPITGESLFSLNLRYWQQRFNQREIKLRLHGASGGLFNTAQATFLSRLKGHQITSLLRQRYSGTARSGSGHILASSKTLGLMRPVGPGLRGKMIEYLNFGRTNAESPDSTKPSMELNLAEMISFVSNITEWGQVRLFEASYETKMEIAQKVCAVTGFEFYQDVDGDFVFKPPMYNLDTSSSRVYRIEDIDLISVNFEESEPNVTYMTGKGDFIKNLQGHGVEGEWGVQGQYIDYRLVAQYGWRAGNFEESYYSDSKSVFFAAMTRMDVLNAPAQSATVTIPLRPELRPGYPVYIPYLDCFYYCPSFSHSFSVGGQCSTTLQLTAKRSKFFAPGDPSRIQRSQSAGGVTGGIDAIQLGDTALPPMPLSVQGSDGQPRLSGFPNVVMALDPTTINPLFLLVGSDVGDLNSYEALSGLMRMAVDLNILTVKDKGNPGPEYVMMTDEGSQITFWFPSKDGLAAKNPANTQSIWSLAAEYTNYQVTFTSDQMGLRVALDAVLQKQAAAESQLAMLEKAEREQPRGKEQSLQGQKDQLRQVIQGLKKEAEQHMAQFEQTKTNFDTVMGDANKVGGVAFFAELVQKAGEQYFKRGSGVDLNSSATLLDLLSDKKIGMCSGSVPGTYRYYSASHPKKEQQGQPIYGMRKTATVKSTTLQNPFLDDGWKDLLVPTYVPTKEIQIQEDGNLPQAMFADRHPVWGLKVLTNRVAGGEVVPTSEIRELMFSVHDVTLSAPKVKTTHGSFTVDMGGSVTSSLRESLNTLVSKANLTMSPAEVFGPWVVKVSSALRAAADEANKVGSGNGVGIAGVDLPQEFQVLGGVWPYDATLDMYLLADNESGQSELFAGSSTVMSSRVWEAAATWLAEEMTNLIRAEKDLWVEGMAGSLDTDVQSERLSTMAKTFGAQYGTEPAKGSVSTNTSKPPKSALPVYMPVFPVSDSKGYRVVGSYRYGRDVSIDPDGVFDVLAKQDPLLMLSRTLVEDVIEVVLNGKGVWVEEDVPDLKSPSGTPAKRSRYVTGPAAAQEVERRVLSSLREHYSDSQILDLGVARATSDPTILQLNLMNWFSEKNKDGVHKLPILNAGFSMAELTTGLIGATCTCKATEADVLLSVASRERFVEVSSSGDSVGAQMPLALGSRGVGDVTRKLMEEAVIGSMDWKASQDALRGVRDISRTSLVTASTDLPSALKNWQAQQDALVATLSSTEVK